MEILASSAQPLRLCNKPCSPHPPVVPSSSTAAIIDSRWYREKLEASRRKLAMNYERELLLKRQRTICVLQPHQLPPPIAPPPPRRRANCIRNLKPARSAGSATSINGGAAGTTRGPGRYRPIKGAAGALHWIQKPACRSHSGSACIKPVRKMSTQMWRHLLKKLGHDVEVPQPLPTSPLPSPSVPVQHLAAEESMKINDAVPAPAMAEAPREHSPVNAAGLQSKQCSGLHIIRKSMFKFVIKLGLAGDNGTGHPMAC